MMNITTEQMTTNEEPWLEVISSRNFSDWLARENISLAFSTYQAGKVFLLGRKKRWANLYLRTNAAALHGALLN